MSERLIVIGGGGAGTAAAAHERAYEAFLGARVG